MRPASSGGGLNVRRADHKVLQVVPTRGRTAATILTPPVLGRRGASVPSIMYAAVPDHLHSRIICKRSSHMRSESTLQAVARICLARPNDEAYVTLARSLRQEFVDRGINLLKVGNALSRRTRRKADDKGERERDRESVRGRRRAFAACTRAPSEELWSQV